MNSTDVYKIRPRKDKRGFDLISDALPFGGLWYTKAGDAVEYAEYYSRSHPVVIRVYDEARNVIETHEHKGEFNPQFADKPTQIGVNVGAPSWCRRLSARS